MHLTLGQQAVMLLTLLVSSKGTAGVARASLVIVMAAAASFHLPTEPLFLLFGIDQLMDMGRTAVNVVGNCLASVVVARWERSEEHTSELQSHLNIVCRLLLEKNNTGSASFRQGADIGRAH